MIDKVIPQRLNSDVDSRFRPSTDMIDALNIAFQESYNTDAAAADSGASVSFSGDAGVIKPMPSNRSVQSLSQTSVINNNTNIRVIGSVSDEVFNVIYFFAWSNQNNQMGVYAWDQDGVLPGATPGAYVKVYTSPKFNFPSDGFVKADVVHVGQRKNIEDQDRVRNVILYFTDNRNEPRKLSVYDVMEADLSSYNDIDFLDMITACPRTPLEPISFQFDFDPARASSNFTSLPGLQFAYQHVYSDNVESALSTYSRLAVPPAYLALGQVTGSVNLQNRCILNVPRGSREVDRIRVLVRYGNLGLWRLIDEIKELPDAVDTVQYNFYNDRILIPVSEETTAMPYSNLPRIAQAQSVVSDRLVYGNYVESYPEVDASAIISPQYRGTPRQGDVIEIDVVPVINQLSARTDDANSTTASIYTQLGTNRVAGYQINLDGVPSDVLEAGTIIQLEFTVEPDDNFHFYNQHNSYHGGRENGFFGGGNNLTDEDLDNVNDPLIDIDGGSGEPVNNVNQYSRGRQYFGKNSGVKFIDGLNKWKYYGWGTDGSSYGNIISFPGSDDTVDVKYGTSAANPFILHSRALRFSLTFKTLVDSTTPRQHVRETIYALLTGTGTIPTVEGGDFASTEDFPDPVTISSYDIDLSLNSGDKILSGYANDYRKHLIVGLTRDSGGAPSSHTEEPIGYFIVNKAQVQFGLKAFTYMQTQYDEVGSENCYIGLDLQSLTNVEVMTCIPYVPVGRKIAVSIDATPFDANNDWFGVMPLNIINGSIGHWKVFSRGEIQSTDVQSLNIYDTATVSDWPGNVAYTPTGVNEATMSDDTRNLYFFDTANQYLSVFAEQNSDTGNNFEGSSVNPIVGDSDGTPTGIGLALAPAIQNSGRGAYCIGYLQPESGADGDQLNLIHTSNEIFTSAAGSINSTTIVSENAVFSLVDGEGGPGFTKNRSGIGEFVSWGSISPYVLFKGDIHNRWIIDFQNLPYTGYIPLTLGGGSNNYLKLYDSNPKGDEGWKKSKGFLKAYRNLEINTPENQLGQDYFQGNTADLTYDHPISDTLNTWIEITVLTTYITGITGLYYPRSFKTNANHDFGIVYYDQRGRSGNVNYLGNTFVKGYSNADRGLDAKGRVDIRVLLTSDPPEWATQYQIVYSPNSTIDEFVQYSTGPAFVASTKETNPASGDEALIYVNLGHLQGVNNVSYSHAFGAVNNDGGKDLYTHRQGDRLRILYYTDPSGDESDVLYPNNYVFDIVDVVTLPENANDNILSGGGDSNAIVHPSRSGQFLVLKNNPEATGFTYSDILDSYDDEAGYLDGASAINFWNNRTVVEIFTPKKVQDFDQRLYYEIGEKYDITIDQFQNPVHSRTSILLSNGDVWWRRVPVNLQSFDTESQRFVSLFSESLSDDNSIPSFQTQVLETMAFTDVIPGCKTLDWGKPKIIVPGSQSLYKRSSLTYSNKNNYSSRANNYTTFNASSLNFKDLPNEYGAINYILNDYDNVVVIQEDKTSSIPVNRNIITTAGGQQSLVASKDVLGTQKFYAGDYGADNNPEGVVRAGEAIYFAHKGRREVYKLTRSKGLKVISKASMKAHFNNLFIQALKDEAEGDGKVRVVSGYDPLRDEYIISVYNMIDFSTSEINYNPLTGVFDGVDQVFEEEQTVGPFDDFTTPTGFEEFGTTGGEVVDVDDDIIVTPAGDDEIGEDEGGTTPDTETGLADIETDPLILTIVNPGPTTYTSSFKIKNTSVDNDLQVFSISVINNQGAVDGVVLSVIDLPSNGSPFLISASGEKIINYSISAPTADVPITEDDFRMIGVIDIVSDASQPEYSLPYNITYPITDVDEDEGFEDELLPSLELSPDALSFQDVPQGGSPTKNITFTNTGNGDLLINNLTLNPVLNVPDGSAYFELVGALSGAATGTPYTLLPEGSVDLIVKCWAPPPESTITAPNNFLLSTLDISSNIEDEVTTVNLSANFQVDEAEDENGDDGEFEPSDARIQLTPPLLTHTTQNADEAVEGSFQIENQGITDNLTVDVITIQTQQNVFDAEFTILNGPEQLGAPIVIGPLGATTTINYTVSPPTPAVTENDENEYRGLLQISSDDPTQPTALLNFSVQYVFQEGPDTVDPDGGGGDNGNDGQGGQGDGDVSLTPPPPSSTEDQYFGGLGVYGNGFVATTNKRRIKNS
tara:strand:+ start:15100 stop:21579 length:6480 start_codon:yes stop_codon:yes gene_type:complete